MNLNIQTFKDDFLLLNLKANDSKEAQPSVELVLVVDTSGSMKGRPLEMIKHMIQFIEEALRSTAKNSFAIVTFSSFASVLLPMTKIRTDSNDSNVNISKLNAFGGTNLKAGIQLAAQQLTGTAEHQVIILLTDGNANVGETVPERIASSLSDVKKVTFHVVGVGNKINAELLQIMCKSRQGLLCEVDTEEQMVSNMGALLGRVLSVAAKDVKLIMPEGAEVFLGSFYTGEKMSIPLKIKGKQSTIKLNYLDLFGQSQTIIKTTSVFDQKETDDRMLQIHLLRVETGHVLLQLCGTTKDEIESLICKAESLGTHPILDVILIRLKEAIRSIESKDETSFARLARIGYTEIIRQQSNDETSFFCPLLSRSTSSRLSEYVKKGMRNDTEEQEEQIGGFDIYDEELPLFPPVLRRS